MAKYIKLTDALDAVSWDTEAYTAINMLDTVEIIHCKDCKHYVDVRNTEDSSVGKCDSLGFLYTHGEWYCGNAERRTDEID